MLVPALFAFQSLVVGETCPAPVDVEARVLRILHLPPERDLRESFAVERHESGLYVELRSADSTLIGQRTLPAEGNCDELAQAAAVVLAAWLSDVHPDFAIALPAPTAPAPSIAPDSGLPPPLPAAIPSPQPPASPRPSRVAIHRRWQLDLGLGADVSAKASGEAWAFAGYVAGSYRPVAGRWGVSGFLAVTSLRQQRLGPGFVDWRRWPVGLGPSLRVDLGRATWDASAGPVLGWLHFSGSQFDQSSGKDGLAAGGFVAMRVASQGRRAGVFGLANAQFYPGDFAAFANGLGGPWFAPVPRLSVALVLGVWLSP